MTDVGATNQQMLELFRQQRLLEAAALARDLPDGELVWGPHAELWWHFCEALGDAVREHDAALAAKLYSLALQSHVKQGTMATGSGEGLASRGHQERLEGKLDAARGVRSV